MRWTLHCSFGPDTANGILMQGRAKALRKAGHQVRLYLRPFKRPDGNPLASSVLFWQFWRPLWSMLESDIAVIHKALPLGLLYLLLMRTFRPRVRRVLIMDDWEGVGGFASVRSARSVRKKMLVTLCEEWMPRLAHGTVCISRTLERRVRAAHSRPVLCLPNGGEDAGPPSQDRPPLVGYVGTLKSEWLVQFLGALGRELNIDKRLVIVGGGPMLDVLYSLLPSALYTGQVSHGAARDWMRRFSVALLPLSNEYPDSLIDASRSSAKLFEYMSAGCCVVASNVGDVKAVLDHTGIVVPANNPAEWARIVQDIHSGSNVARALYHQKYTHDVLCRQLAEWAGGL